METPVPFLKDLFKSSESNPVAGRFEKLSDVLSGLYTIVLYIAAFMAFYWLIWGAFQYILARGNKEELAKARSRITWALVGLIVIFAAFLIAKYASIIFPPGRGGLPF